MSEYELAVKKELLEWEESMMNLPHTRSQLLSNFQERVNRVIPDNIHSIFTSAVREVTRAVILGSEFTTKKPKRQDLLEVTDKSARKSINLYRSTAAAEGAVTGFGGILMGFADFPLWLSLKMKMLFELASCYGYSTKELHERLFILHIFELTFSSQSHKNKLFPRIKNWEKERLLIPGDLRKFDWKTFQLQYRDHIDLRKLLQLIPGAGAVVGAYVNHQLTGKLGETAMNAYRLRYMVS